MFILLFTLISVGINFPVFKTDATMQTDMAINGGGSGGGGGTTVTSTGSTGTTPNGLAAVMSFDKESYNPGDKMQVTTAMYYTGCTNITRNIMAVGWLRGDSYTSNDQELFNTIIQGQVSNTQTTEMVAPPIPGDYTLHMSITGNYPDDYKAYHTNGALLVQSGDFSSFKSALVEYMFSNYSEYQVDLASVANDINSNAYSLNSISTILNSYSVPINVYNYGGGQAFTRDYDFSPVRVTGVTIYANNQRDVTPVTPVNYGNDVYVKWLPVSSNTCECTCIDKNTGSPVVCGSEPNPNAPSSCGSGTGIDGVQVSNPNPIIGVKSTTTFKVHCE